MGSTLPAYWRLLVSYAVLIDGGFLKRKLGTPREPMTLEHVELFIDRLRSHPALASERLHRIYWYDAHPLEGSAQRPLNGGKVDFSRTSLAQSSHKLFQGLCALPYVSVRRGELVLRGWRIRQGKLPAHENAVTLEAGDIEPNIQQKGVDMRIGLDIASLTMKRHVNTIVLVTGDSDFVPAMKFARREGAQLFLVTLGHPVRQLMIEHADLLLDLTPTADANPQANAA